jgi:hypothetical protein
MICARMRHYFQRNNVNKPRDASIHPCRDFESRQRGSLRIDLLSIQQHHKRYLHREVAHVFYLILSHKRNSIHSWIMFDCSRLRVHVVYHYKLISEVHSEDSTLADQERPTNSAFAPACNLLLLVGLLAAMDERVQHYCPAGWLCCLMTMIHAVFFLGVQCSSRQAA